MGRQQLSLSVTPRLAIVPRQPALEEGTSSPETQRESGKEQEEEGGHNATIVVALRTNDTRGSTATNLLRGTVPPSPNVPHSLPPPLEVAHIIRLIRGELSILRM